ncbi:hypothetical protein QFC22_004271, partial [Naganishia vaughanmartiniae]
ETLAAAAVTNEAQDQELQMMLLEVKGLKEEVELQNEDLMVAYGDTESGVRKIEKLSAEYAVAVENLTKMERLVTSQDEEMQALSIELQTQGRIPGMAVLKRDREHEKESSDGSFHRKR